MARKKIEIEEFTPNPCDHIRKELDGKIEERVSHTAFNTVVGIFIAIITGMCAYIFWQSCKIDSTNTELVRFEAKIDTKIEDHKI